MPIIRNPFRTRAADQLQDENSRPTNGAPRQSNNDYTKSPASPLSVGAKQQRETTDFKLSEINDSGVYLPPSPPERKPGLWPLKSYGSTTSSHRSVLNENEPFNISRESFDSYRRSFDISARSPIIGGSGDAQRGGQSLDVRRSRLPAPSMGDKQFTPLPEAQLEDKFEDVGLNDEVPGKPKKRSLFSRSSDVSSNTADAGAAGSDAARQPSSHFGAHLFTRKRGQSGQGSELGSIPTVRPSSSTGASGGTGVVPTETKTETSTST